MSNNHKIRYLEMGACYNGYSSYGVYKKWLSCAWEPSDCDLTIDGNSFLGTDQDDDFYKVCDPRRQKIGRCLKEDKCAIRAPDCGTGSSALDTNFKADDDSCTIQRDKSKKWDVNNPQFTQFGSCRDRSSGDHFCIYNPSDCDESGTEVYVNAADTLAAGVICDCSEVHVSGCVTDSKRAFCAINADGCRPTWPYYSPHKQRLDRDPNYSGGDISPTPGLDCRLCKRVNTATPTLSPTTSLTPTKTPSSNPSNLLPTALPIETPTKTPTLSPNISALKNPDKTEEKSSNTGVIIGASVGGAAFVGILVVAYVKMFRGLEERKKQKRKSRRKRPVPEIFTE